MTLLKDLNKAGGRRGLKIGIGKCAVSKKRLILPKDLRFKDDTRPIRDGYRIFHRETPYYNGQELMEHERLSKFGSKVRLDLDQPLSSQPTIIEDDQGVSLSIKTPTLRSWLEKTLHLPPKTIKNNGTSIIEGLMKVLTQNKKDISQQETKQIKEVLLDAFPNQTNKISLEKRYCTKQYYKANTATVLLALANNAKINGLPVSNLIISASNNLVNESALRNVDRRFVIDIQQNRIVPKGDLDDDEILDRQTEVEVKDGSEALPLAVPVPIRPTVQSIRDDLKERIDTDSTGTMKQVIESFDGIDSTARVIFEYHLPYLEEDDSYDYNNLIDDFLLIQGLE